VEEKIFINEAIEEELDWLKKMVQSIRTIRSEMSISPAKPIPLYLKNVSSVLEERVKKYLPLLQSLCKINSIHFLLASETNPISASAVVGEIELLIPMASLIDKDAELTRLAKELGKLEKEISVIEGKLNNPHFTDKAPAEIILKEKERLNQAVLVKEKLLHHQASIQTLE